jgi:hypothetical protein
MKSYLDTHLRVVHHSLDCGRTRVVFWPPFLNFGHVLGPSLKELGLWVGKKRSLFPSMKTYLDIDLRVVHHSIEYWQRHVVLGPLFLNFGSRSRPKFERKWDYGLE